MSAQLELTMRLTPALLALLLLPSAARAQDSWGVIVATTRPTEMARAVETAEHSAAALEASVGGVISSDRAIARVESGLSEPFHPVPPELARRLGQAAESVLEDVAFGRNQRALDVGQPLLAELDPHLAGVGRDPQASSDVANLCLYLVRAHVQMRDVEAARAEMQVCIRLVPDLTADARLHPPSVRELLTDARAQLEEGRGAILAIHAGPTDPEGCAIRVNGRRVGQTPWARVPLPPGTYLVQIECDPERAGRAHRAQVAGDAPTRIVIRARLSEALQTRPALALVYADARELAAHLQEDVGSIAEALGATRMLAAIDDGRSLAVRAFAVTVDGTTLVGSAPVPEPIDDVRSREAVRAVLSGRQVDPQTEELPVEAPSRASGGDGNVASIVLGTLIAIGGAAGLAVGWFYWAELESRWSQWDSFDESDIPTSRYIGVTNDLETYPWIVVGTGAGGGALLTLALPFLLPDTGGEVPWWSLVIGAGGVALGIAGGWEIAQTPQTIGGEGITPRETVPAVLGGHLIAHGVPLLAVPLVYLVRAATGGDRASGASIHVDSERAELRVWGRF